VTTLTVLRTVTCITYQAVSCIELPVIQNMKNACSNLTVCSDPPPAPHVSHMVNSRVVTIGRGEKKGNGQLPLDNSPSDIFPLPCSVRVRVRSGFSRVRIGSVGLV